LTCTPAAAYAARSRSDCQLEVTEISEGVKPASRARASSRGEQASMRTSPSARRVASTPEWRFAFIA
jgi:hypothetical protein